MKKQSGFSLIELVVVVAIVVIIAAIAIPRFQRATRAANDASAISSVRLIAQAEHTYRAATSATEFAHLGVLKDGSYIDETLGGGGGAATTATKSGFDFQSTVIASAPATAPEFIISAKPTTTTPLLATGNRRFAMPSNNLLYSDIGTIDEHYTTITQLTSGSSGQYSPQ